MRDNVRKNQGVGGAPQMSTAGLDVVAPSYVRAKQTDPSGILSALGNYASRKKYEGAQLAENAARAAEKQAALEKEERDKLAAAEGRSDQGLGRVDEERMKVDSIYAENVRLQQVEGDGLMLLGNGIPELEAAMEAQDFNLREWQQAKLQEFAREDGALGAKSLAAQNGFVTQFLQQTTLHHAARQQDILDKQAEAGFDNLLFAGLRTHTATLDDLSALEARGSRVGLTPEEVQSKTGKALLSLYGATGDSHFFKLAQQRGLLDTMEFGADFLKQKEINDEKWRRKQEEAKTRDALASLQLHQQLDEMSQNHTLTPQYVSELVNAKRITLAQGEGWLKRQNADLRSETEKAARAAERAAKEKEVADAVAAEAAVVADSFGKGQDALAFAMSKNPHIPKKRWEDYANKKYATAVEAVGAAMALPDGPDREAAMSQASTNLSNAMREAHKANMLPAMVQSTFNGISLDTPERVIQLSGIYEDMKARGMGNFVRDNISTGAYMVLENFRAISEVKGPEEAVRLLADGRRKPEDAAAIVNGMDYRELYSATKEITDDYEFLEAGTVEQALKQSAMTALLNGAPRENVAELAKTYFKEAYTSVDNNPVPRSHLAAVDEEVFKQNYPAYISDVLIPEIQEIANISEVRLNRVPGRPGKFFLTSPELSGDQMVKRKDGTLWVVDAEEMIDQGSRVRATERRKLAEVLFESRLRE